MEGECISINMGKVCCCQKKVKKKLVPKLNCKMGLGGEQEVTDIMRGW
jgi:hypothetical protein